jgi:hypothetical protein
MVNSLINDAVNKIDVRLNEGILSLSLNANIEYDLVRIL